MWKYVPQFNNCLWKINNTRFHRSLTRPAFTRDRTSDYELFDRHAGVVISQLKQRLRQGFAVDFQVRFIRFRIRFLATLG